MAGITNSNNIVAVLKRVTLMVVVVCGLIPALTTSEIACFQNPPEPNALIHQRPSLNFFGGRFDCFLVSAPSNFRSSDRIFLGPTLGVFGLALPVIRVGNPPLGVMGSVVRTHAIPTYAALPVKPSFLRTERLKVFCDQTLSASFICHAQRLA